MVHVRHILLQSTRKAPHGAIGFTDVVVAINEDVEVFEGFWHKESEAQQYCDEIPLNSSQNLSVFLEK